jgi:hypothetical protein
MGGDDMFTMGGEQGRIADQLQGTMSDMPAEMIESGNRDLGPDSARLAHGQENGRGFLDADCRSAPSG